MENVFSNMRVKTLITLMKNIENGIYISQIFKPSGMSFSTIQKIIKEMENSNFIVREKNGRIKEIRLTENGKLLKRRLNSVNKILKTT